jgi:hypothetical membrane protein
MSKGHISESHRGRLANPLLICGLVSSPLSMIAVIIIGQITPEINVLSETLSKLGASNSLHSTVFNTIMIFHGGVMVGVAYAFWLKLGRTRLANYLRILLTIYGLGIIFSAILNDSLDPLTTTAMLEDVLHSVSVSIAYLALIIVILSITMIQYRNKTLKPISYFAIAILCINAILPFMLLMDKFEPLDGLMQRISFGGSIIWLMLFSMELLRMDNHDSLIKFGS